MMRGIAGLANRGSRAMLPRSDVLVVSLYGWRRGRPWRVVECAGPARWRAVLRSACAYGSSNRSTFSAPACTIRKAQGLACQSSRCCFRSWGSLVLYAHPG